MATLREIQDLYSKYNLGNFTTYNDRGTTYLQLPGVGGSIGAVYTNPDLSQLDTSKITSGGALSGMDANGISWTNASETFQRAQQNTSSNPNYLDSIYSNIQNIAKSRELDQQAIDSNLAAGKVGQQTAAQTLPQVTDKQADALGTGQAIPELGAAGIGNASPSGIEGPQVPVVPPTPQGSQGTQTPNLANNPQAQQQGFYKVRVPVTPENPGGFDIYKADGTPIKDIEEFKKLGLNADWIPEKTGTGTGTGTGTQSKSPVDFAGIFSEVAKSLGLTDLKGYAEETRKQLAGVQNELNDKIAEINDNPWLSEGLRTKKITSLQEKYEGKLKNITTQLELYDSLYKLGVAQAQFLTTGTYNQMIDTAELALKVEEAKSKLNGGTSDLQEYNFAVKQGYKGTFMNWQKDQANLKDPTSTKNTFNADLMAEIGKVYAGTYGTQGARDKAAAVLKAKYPNEDVGQIYSRIPDGYEQNIVPSKRTDADMLIELERKSNGGENLDALTPAEQAEYYRLMKL